MVGWIKMSLGTEVGLGPCDVVLDGDTDPPKGAQPPPLFGPCLLWPQSPTQCFANVYCCQTAGWIKMSLGAEVDLDPGHIVLDGAKLRPPRKGA